MAFRRVGQMDTRIQVMTSVGRLSGINLSVKNIGQKRIGVLENHDQNSSANSVT